MMVFFHITLVVPAMLGPPFEEVIGAKPDHDEADNPLEARAYVSSYCAACQGKKQSNDHSGDQVCDSPCSSHGYCLLCGHAPRFCG
jgi:hypothetical protein